MTSKPSKPRASSDKEPRSPEPGGAWGPALASMDAQAFARVSKALADPQRFALLERIAQGPEVACMTLVAEFPITQATISHHLKELSRAGLVTTRKEGKCCHFAVQRDVIERYRAELARRVGL